MKKAYYNDNVVSLPAQAPWQHLCTKSLKTLLRKIQIYDVNVFPLSLITVIAVIYITNPHKPHFYIVKLRFTGVYIIFLFLLKNIDCVYSLEPPRRGGAVLTSTHNLCFEQKYEKYQNFFVWKF